MIHEGLTDAFHDIHMGVTAENLVERYGISRADQDAFAAESQARAAAAIREGRFKDEIVPVPCPARRASRRWSTPTSTRAPGTTAESLGKLKPAFKDGGTVTAGQRERPQRRRGRAGRHQRRAREVAGRRAARPHRLLRVGRGGSRR